VDCVVVTADHGVPICDGFIVCIHYSCIVERQNKEQECQEKKIRRLRRFGRVQHIENVSLARQALHWIPTEKRKTEDYMERHNNERHQPHECDVGWNLPNSNGQTRVECMDHPMC